MLRWIGHSLQRKLSVIILAATLIPLLSLGVFAYLISSRITEENTKQSGIDTLAQMQGNLRFILEDVNHLSIFLIGEREVQQYLRTSGGDENARTRIQGFLSNLVVSKPYVSHITIYPANGDVPISTMTLYESELDKQLDIRQVTEKRWTGLYSIVNYAGRQNVFSFIRPLRGIGDYRPLGWVSITLDEQAVSRYWKPGRLGEGQGRIALLNEQGVILSSTEKEWLAVPVDSLFPGLTDALENPVSGTATYGQGADKQTVLYYREPLVGWTIVGLVPFEQYSARNRYILLLTAAAVTVSVLATAALILYFVRRVTNPLRALTRLLSKLNPDEPLPLYPASTSDEIGRLAQSYNRLGSHIEKLKRELIRGETRKKEADMRALQAQINPHFLYNTLSSIHWMALMTEEKRIADMVGALSDFLRFSLNKGKEYCPVHQEIAHIRNYAQVQSIRYPDKFDIDFTLDPSLQDKFMLKLLLQPLVENAMIHGIQKKEGRGTISVYVGREGDRMSFIIQDDGVGMTKERLEAIRGSLRLAESGEAPDISYGLRNVHERLLLHYGPEAGLRIDSREQAGTRVSFSIPVLEESHENHDR